MSYNLSFRNAIAVQNCKMQESSHRDKEKKKNINASLSNPPDPGRNDLSEASIHSGRGSSINTNRGLSLALNRNFRE